MRPLDPRLLKYAATARKYIIFSVLTGFLTSALVLAQAIFISHSISPIITNDKNIPTTTYSIIALLVVFALRFFLTIWHDALAHKAGQAVIVELRQKVLTAATKLGHRWLQDGNSTAVSTLISQNIKKIDAYFVDYLPQLFLCATVTPVALLLIAYEDLVSAAIIFFCLPLIPIFMILIGKLTQSFASDKLQALQHLSTELIDLLAGLPTLKSFGRQMGPAARVASLGRAYTKTTMQTLRVAFISGAALEFIATLCTALVAVEVGFRMVYGYIGLTDGLIIIMITPEVYKPLREVGTKFHASADGLAACNQAFDLLDQAEKVSESKIAVSTENGSLSNTAVSRSSLVSDANIAANTEANNGTPTTPNRSLSYPTNGVKISAGDINAIELIDIGFYNEKRASWTPRQVTGSFTRGRLNILSGPSGAGKSTVIELLLKLIAPSHGHINITNKQGKKTDLSAVDTVSWREIIEWVPQRAALLPGDVASNFYRFTELPQEATDKERLRKALAATGFDQVLASLPRGWDTPLASSGSGISLGQRQRLVLARALYSPKPIVILDEPTAHLDAQSEEVFLQTLKELKEQNRLVIVVAHRPSLIALADTVLNLETPVSEARA